MENKIQQFKVGDIAKWNLQKKKNSNSGNNEFKINLPDIQRGFVWNPRRIEDLWDSLFRGFPVGSFLVSEIKKNEFDLLDGQQRATSVGIGLNNPWLDENNDQHRIIWLDISRQKSGPYKFEFKLITSSHPWGFTNQKNPNLEEELRREAFDKFKEIGSNTDKIKYYDFDIKLCWPWVATLPIPLCFFSEAINNASANEEIRDYLFKIIKERLGHIQTKKEKTNFRKSIVEFLESSDFIELLPRIKNLLNTTVPAITLNKDLIEGTTQIARVNPISDDDWLRDEEEEQNKDIIEEIFERVNSKGVPLEGEDLIYSIFKSQCPDANGIPEKCSYVRPAKLVSLCIKLVMAQSKENVPNRIEISVFKNWIKKKGNSDKLTKLLTSLNGPDNIFDQAKKIFCGDKDFQISYYQLNQFAESNQDAFWILLARLNKGDTIQIGSDLHRTVLGFITTLGFFGKRGSRQTSLPALGYLMERIQTIESAKEFWSANTIRHALRFIKYRNATIFALTPMPAPSHLRAVFDTIYKTRDSWWDLKLSIEPRTSVVQFFKRYLQVQKTDNVDQLEENYNDAIESFVGNLRDSDGLLSFALRSVIKDWFDDFYIKKIDLTHRPWDVDHIYATKLTKKRSIANTKILSSWQDTIGNKRYWPMELNRGAGGSSPGHKLTFDLDAAKKEEFKNFNIKNEEDLLKRSLITKEWQNIWGSFEGKREASNVADEVVRLIFERLITIYSDWYNQLNIEKLFPIK